MSCAVAMVRPWLVAVSAYVPGATSSGTAARASFAGQSDSVAPGALGTSGTGFASAGELTDTVSQPEGMPEMAIFP
ncbi:hypothetical protein OG429_02405 [Streptomyces sp. NBC_00190]|uniref:hypothetical protein n=1 Tax=unclassified Streptomyces TaxID=2593676 RepID=UPI002E29A863|nr:hypothetical protein [Streptomyces sp. NBC_00190]WSZ38269.1 hypothetical protein OG239_05400 [Streptomyces sp. NBC_00868]